MNLKTLTKNDVEQFAPSKIYERGVGYYHGGRVLSLESDPMGETIAAEVEGNYGDYTVEITTDDEYGIDAVCDCPYDGYPCKHMVAVLLAFVHERGQYLEEARKTEQQVSSLEGEVKGLPKDELVKMVMSCARKYPDFKRELIVRFEAEKPATFEAIKKQIQQAFPSIMSNSYSVLEIVRTLNSILKSVESAPENLQVDVYWAVADNTLAELNEYGMSEEALEEVAIDSMEKLPPLLQENPALKEKKEKILAELMRYYIWSNCGITDFIYETADNICAERSDYEIVIDALKKESESDSSSYHITLLANLYAQIGEEDAQLKTLESRLEYGTDYWRLAEYWLDKEQPAKALDIVKEGIEKGRGRKSELYLHLQEHYEEKSDYGSLAELLRLKIQREELDYRSFASDELYKCLKRHYEATDDYTGQVALLELRLESGELDCEFYQEAEWTIRDEDWQEFEERFIAKAKAQENSKLLAEIYEYKGDMEALWKIAKNDRELLKEYEAGLTPIYPQEYLKLYQSIIDRYIAARGRDNYRAAAEYAETVKEIYLNLLKQPEQWDAYIEQLRKANKALRAMKDEFRNL